MLRKPPKLLAVLWRDTTGRSGWFALQDAQQVEPSYMLSAGFVVAETKSKITLSLTHIVEGDVGCGDFISIPRGCIISTAEIKEPKWKSPEMKATAKSFSTK